MCTFYDDWRELFDSDDRDLYYTRIRSKTNKICDSNTNIVNYQSKLKQKKKRIENSHKVLNKNSSIIRPRGENGADSWSPRQMSGSISNTTQCNRVSTHTAQL